LYQAQLPGLTGQLAHTLSKQKPIRLVKRIGFREEARYVKGLLINGKWAKIQDIVLYLLLKATRAIMKITKTKMRWGIILLLLAIIISLASYPTTPQDPIQYYERESGQIKTEKVAGEKWLVWLYYNPIGEATLWALAKRKLASTIYGNMMNRTYSAKKIHPFIEDFDIDMSIVQEQEFKNFNDFFTRKLKVDARPIDTSINIVVSPADGKILAYSDISNSDFIIKGKRFDVSSFLDNPDLAQKYHDGSLLIIRLAPFDYHRFHFPVSGKLSQNKKIEGDYYSVNPFALRKKAEIFCLNKREYTIISNLLFGDVIMAEVGATMVGCIIQTFKGRLAKKGEEKGYFKFGGSTVVLLFEKSKIHIDEDLLINTANGYETTVKMGERIGEEK
jgi:phosphatidylserine decarboxylase